MAELCCGSGELSRALALEAGLRHEIVAVDAQPRPELARHGSGDVRAVRMQPWEFARFPTRYDRILMKDAWHAVDDPAAFVAQIRERLTAGGSFSVILTVPDPRFEPEILQTLGCAPLAGLDSGETAAILQANGYAVRRSHVQLARRMTWSDYLQLVRSRHLPALCCLSDPQLQSRLHALQPRRPPGEPIDVSHHFDIVSGSRLN